MARRLSLKPAEYALLDKVVGLKDNEYYAIVGTKMRGQMVRSVHVFARLPMTTELKEYENTASRTTFKGQKAKIEGSQIVANKHLYNALIDRVYEVPVGWKIHAPFKRDAEGNPVEGTEPLSRDEAIRLVPDLIKREALTDTVSQHYSETKMSEMDDEDEKVYGEVED